MSRRVPGRSSTALRFRRATSAPSPSRGAGRPCPGPSYPTPIRVVRETHEAPAAVQERLARAGGMNRFNEPNFRVVWGGSRLSWIGGSWSDRDGQGNLLRKVTELRQVPKYLPVNRWHIERWMPPEAYGSREQWYRETTEYENGAAIPALGPYPSRGEYEHCFTLEKGGEFVQLTPSACDWIVRAIEWARKQPRSAARAALRRREARAERNWDQAADALLGEASRAFDGNAFVALA